MSVAILLSAAVTVVLMTLLAWNHRVARETEADAGASAFRAEASQLLESRGRELAHNAAPLIAAARLSRDERALGRVARSLLLSPDVAALEVRDEAGERLYASETYTVMEASGGLAPVIRIKEPLPGGGTLMLLVSEAGIPGGMAEIREKVLANQQASFERAMWALTGLGILVATLAGVIGWLLARRVERPVTALIHAAERIGSGDYTAPVDVAAPGEIAELEAAIESMRQQLRETTITTAYLTNVLDSMSDAVIVTSPDGVITRANEAATRLFRYEESDLTGLPFAELIADQERSNFDVATAAGETRETVVRTRSGQTIPASLSGSRLTGDDPQFHGAIFVLRNITDRKRAERRIRYLARYDALTKIPNRMQFQHMLQQTIARTRRSEGSIVLLYLDLDRFKEINDTFGHSAGDRTLEILSERLTSTLPREAVLGRLAGDEFALFVGGLPAGEAGRNEAADLARLVLEQISKALYVQQHEVYVTASIGIAFCPKDAENVIDLIRDADAAMYHSKQSGGNTFAFYSPEMSAAAVERLMLKSKLRRALEREELVLYYQPKVDLRDGRIIGAEALLRWRLPGHGDIPPAQFIPLAEETNLIVGIGEWVLNRVCADYREWQQRVADPGRVSINLSLRQLHQASFITRCRSVFKQHGVSPTFFELEITETTLMTDARRTVRLLDELYSMGLHLSIDDFGTGYSSLSALQQFPIGTLKIDQSFVRNASEDPDDATIVRTIIDMGRSLEMEVVAEGVETEAQLALLRSRGCHYAQGRLFGDPMSAEDFLEILIAQQAGTRRLAPLFA
ncbi:MAG TPA: EAL domain-containing protein [Steroidobacteraceae bacterium]|nr:EAL domain-containing protein [Steroidobacteraceae bacterium]